MKLTISDAKPIDVVKRMIFLAYEACGGAVGMGKLQVLRLQGKKAEEDQIWRCAYGEEDYPGGRLIKRRSDNEIYCDYVFGRMMKWGCKWDENSITFCDSKFDPEYESFCRVYPDERSLAEAALHSLAITSFEWEAVTAQTH